MKQAGLIVIAFAILMGVVIIRPGARQKHSIQVDLNQTLSRMNDEELAQVKNAGLADIFESCSVNIDVMSPLSLRIGKTEGIGLSNLLDCPSSIQNLPELKVRSRIQEDTGWILPGGEITTQLVRGVESSLGWAVKPQDSGHWKGTLWVYLDHPRDSEMTISILLVAVPLKMDFVSLAGLSQNDLLWGCVMVGFIGLVMILLSKIKIRPVVK